MFLRAIIHIFDLLYLLYSDSDVYSHSRKYSDPLKSFKKMFYLLALYKDSLHSGLAIP